MTYRKNTPVSSPPQNWNCDFLGPLLLFSMMSKDPDVDSMFDVFLKWLTQVHNPIILGFFFQSHKNLFSWMWIKFHENPVAGDERCCRRKSLLCLLLAQRVKPRLAHTGNMDTGLICFLIARILIKIKLEFLSLNMISEQSLPNSMLRWSFLIPVIS